ncbi:hypothetical protein K0M31_008221 [Melipona bicolor]|uniref:Coiled-coil-helix-coiled-coil-helix domain-containing protein 7 n=1 Tax=Melipona bicolor TaxID=60889 RepID=A0AA40FQJ0_9HYME|nr:hypothetical protein K0M31_008221 [Melipona bicolor]
MSVSGTHYKKQVSTLKEKLTQDQELINPCFQESNISARCLEKNRYDYSKCFLEFENYKLCKKVWRKIIYNRKMKDIKPHIPLPEEREKIKQEYFQSKWK